MGNEFSLIQQLNDPKPQSTESQLPSGIKYQKINVMVEKQELEVFIPLKESSDFETAISKNGKYLNSDEFRKLMREHRGILNRE